MSLTSAELEIPADGTATVTASAAAYDADGNAIEGAAIAYSLPADYTGVTINGETGVVTVTPQAQAGIVTIQAQSGDVTASAALTLTARAPISVSIDAVSGASYYVALTGEMVESFAGKQFAISYDAAIFEIEDLCAMTYGAATAVGAIQNTDLTVVSISNGTIVMSCSKAIPTGKKWSGVINVLKLKAKASGSGVLSVIVN